MSPLRKGPIATLAVSSHCSARKGEVSGLSRKYQNTKRKHFGAKIICARFIPLSCMRASPARRGPLLPLSPRNRLSPPRLSVAQPSLACQPLLACSPTKMYSRKITATPADARLVILEGNIRWDSSMYALLTSNSAGKTSLAKDLAKVLGFQVFLEPTITNPLYGPLCRAHAYPVQPVTLLC
jgi:hypothetical protein